MAGQSWRNIVNLPPTQIASHHQVSYIFRFGNLYKPKHLPLIESWVEAIESLSSFKSRHCQVADEEAMFLAKPHLFRSWMDVSTIKGIKQKLPVPISKPRNNYFYVGFFGWIC